MMVKECWEKRNFMDGVYLEIFRFGKYGTGMGD